MPATNLNSIEMPADDLETTKTFYSEAFGWVFTDYGPSYAAAQVSGLEIGFNAEASVSQAQANGDQNPTGPLLLLESNDLEAIHTSLRRDGSVIVTSPFDFPGGRRFHFRDPNGNVLGIYQAAHARD